MQTYKNTSETPMVIGSGIGDGSQLHTFEARVAVPFSLAVVCGLITFILALIFCLRFYPAEKWFISSLAFILGFANWWFKVQLNLDQKLNRLIGLAELAIGRNLDNDPRVGNGIKPTIKSRVEVDVVEGNTHEIERHDDAELLATVAREIVKGAPFSAALIERDILTRGEWEAMRDELMLHNHIALRDMDNPLKGYEITKAGMAFFRWMAE